MSSKKKTHVLDNEYYQIQNILDILDLSNEISNFLRNTFLTSKKKVLFLYTIFNIENITTKLIKFIQFKNNISSAFMILCKKKKWVQLNVITAIPLSSFIEEYLLKFLKRSNKNIKFFILKKVNNNIIGGFNLCIEDKEWNNSLNDNIRKLRIHLKNNI